MTVQAHETVAQQVIATYYRARVIRARQSVERAHGQLLDAQADLDTWNERGVCAHPGDPVAIVWAASADAARLARAGAGYAVWAPVQAVEGFFAERGIDVTTLDG